MKITKNSIMLILFFCGLLLLVPVLTMAGSEEQPGEVAVQAEQSGVGQIEEDEYEAEGEEADADIADPLLAWNTVWYHFNDRLYFWVLKPVAQGYKAVTPIDVRIVIRNFFHNLAAPIRLVNCVLQGKGEAAGHELGRFVVNTTVGILGLADPATGIIGPGPGAEDLGQTLGHYRIGNGFYLVWPFLGPSSLRDTVGRAGDYFLDPVSYLEEWETILAVNTFEQVNDTAFKIGDYEDLKEGALDPYVAIRNAYVQHRAEKVAE
ncbi:MAG: VacJ family lipoprotein [Desulfobacterales bacterium]|nr:VacJ family lipoprotein [Desulfobacterales bacterium]